MSETQTTGTVDAAPKRTRKAAAATSATVTPAPEAPKAATASLPKLRWTIEETFANGKTQWSRVGTLVYRIEKVGDEYLATLRVDGHKQTETLANGSFARCYAACVARNRAEAAAVAA